MTESHPGNSPKRKIKSVISNGKSSKNYTNLEINLGLVDENFEFPSVITSAGRKHYLNVLWKLHPWYGVAWKDFPHHRAPNA